MSSRIEMTQDATAILERNSWRSGCAWCPKPMDAEEGPFSGKPCAA
jgi:hypothetical protein